MYLFISLILILYLSLLFNNTYTRPYFINVPYSTKTVDFTTLKRATMYRIKEIENSLYFSKCLHLWQVLSNVSVVNGCLQYVQISHHGLYVWELLRDMSVLSIRLIYIL